MKSKKKVVKKALKKPLAKRKLPFGKLTRHSMHKLAQLSTTKKHDIVAFAYATRVDTDVDAVPSIHIHIHTTYHVTSPC